MADDRGPTTQTEAEQELEPEGVGVEVMSMLYKNHVLGVAYVLGNTLHFCEVADAAPDFQMLQSLKFELNPSKIVVPTSSDSTWLSRVAAPAHASGGATDDANADETDASFTLVYSKSRDFTQSAAARRLGMLTNCTASGDWEWTEREILLHLEHILPREDAASLCAVGGLLAHLQQNTAAPLAVSKLERHRLERVMRVSPETMLALNIFEDRMHPSIHGGRKREGFSVWAMMNQTRSKPGEHKLRSWFARPIQDVATLTERLDTVDYFFSRADLVPILQAPLSKCKDVSKLSASFERGGLLLSDFHHAMSTAGTAVKLRDLLVQAEIPLDQVPVAARLHAACSAELADIANMICQVIDFDASKRAGVKPDICVLDGVSSDLDDLRGEYATMEAILTRVARDEYARLVDCGMMAEIGGGAHAAEKLFIIYASQYGFMLKMPMPRVLPLEEEAAMQHFMDAGLVLQFHECGDGYFKTQICEELDEQYGDIGFRMKDLEAQIVRLLEDTLLQSLPSLTAAQAALAELDGFLSLASCASQFNLVRPDLTEDNVVDIKDGWHPLLQSQGSVSQLVPNDCSLGATSRRQETVASRNGVDADEVDMRYPRDEENGSRASSGRLMLLTGPNASGKTVYLRTVAIITFLAHVGSFVPAACARIGITDAIYTRMISKESTLANASAFMLDLSQMALMIRHASPRSLCLIDEFGKGTYAQDGICMLYACLNHFLSKQAQCPRVLACTHFTELLSIRSFVHHPQLTLWTMQVMQQAESGNQTTLDAAIFLYRAVPGSCSDSFGWHCALTAGVPKRVVERARQIAQCRRAGRPIVPRSSGDAEADAEAAMQARIELVDDFLEWDMNARGVDTFFEKHANTLTAIRQARSRSHG